MEWRERAINSGAQLHHTAGGGGGMRCWGTTDWKDNSKQSPGHEALLLVLLEDTLPGGGTHYGLPLPYTRTDLMGHTII